MGPQAFVALMRSFGLALSLSLFGATLIAIVKATDLYSSSVVGVGAIGPPFGFVFTFVGPIGALTLAPLGVTFLQILFISGSRRSFGSRQEEGRWCGELLVPEFRVLDRGGVACAPRRGCHIAQRQVGIELSPQAFQLL